MVRDCPPDKRDLRDWDEIRDWARDRQRALIGDHPSRRSLS